MTHTHTSTPATAGRDADLWIRRFAPSPQATTQVVCLPHAGGSASFFHPMAQALSPAVEVLSVQYPARQDRYREPGIDDLRVLTEHVLAALLATVDRPFALFGHSMGATLAFELGVRLQQAGRAPLRVFASGRRAPSRHRDERVHERDDDGIIAEMRQLSGTDQRVFGDEELLRMVLPAIRNDYRAVERYRFEPGTPRLVCPVTTFTGDVDPRVSAEEAAAWEEHTDGDFELHTYAGGHFFLVEHAADVIRIVGERMAKAS
ncbi:thioesterase II family protein [Streptomyces sp. 4N509B]|uniref:thioesterase II family protein n=1 Tax=Streptomyces sp. 4N509B TaxID=3457413 RepID=UPI003FD28F31